jgi:transposase InsO family protein
MHYSIIICVYGVPSNIHTDNGSQYCSIKISSLTNHFNIKHGLSIAYSKQESGNVERVNKEFNRHMRALMARPNQSDKWTFMLPLVQCIINASNHVATCYSPTQLLFGDSVDHMRGIFPTSTTSSDGPMSPNFTNTHEWLTHLLLQQQTFFKVCSVQPRGFKQS